MLRTISHVFCMGCLALHTSMEIASSGIYSLFNYCARWAVLIMKTTILHGEKTDIHLRLVRESASSSPIRLDPSPALSTKQNISTYVLLQSPSSVMPVRVAVQSFFTLKQILHTYQALSPGYPSSPSLYFR
ncbi:hypothetical protein BDQ17DRAFT_738782 [Cyathus striatus]|nr:hypothetical protein BDQ17DRAFT_738782 [Cyathus striatus]